MIQTTASNNSVCYSGLLGCTPCTNPHCAIKPLAGVVSCEVSITATGNWYESRLTVSTDYKCQHWLQPSPPITTVTTDYNRQLWLQLHCLYITLHSKAGSMSVIVLFINYLINILYGDYTIMLTVLCAPNCV